LLLVFVALRNNPAAALNEQRIIIRSTSNPQAIFGDTPWIEWQTRKQISFSTLFPTQTTPPLSQFYLLEILDPVLQPRVETELAKLRHIIDFEPDQPQHANLVPNDSLYTEQWSLHNTGQAHPWFFTSDSVGTPGCDINMEAAWEVTRGNSNIIIGLVDSGVDLTHPEFSGRILPGYDFINNDDDPTDDLGHGTKCAGIMAAAVDNQEGIAGVAPLCLLLPVKVLDQDGNGWASITAQGIIYAVDNGARVVNISLGGSGSSSTLEAAVSYAYDHGATLVCSAGNEDEIQVNYPASYDETICVAALSPCCERANPSSCDNEWWWGSSYGEWVDVTAPGVRMHTTAIGGGYVDDFNGTSAATPLVTGIVALMLSINPLLDVEEIRTILAETAVDLGNPGFDVENGWGIPDAEAALTASISSSPVVIIQNVQATDLSGDLNGHVDPGEDGGLDITLENFGGDAADITLTASEYDFYLELDQDSWTLPSLPGGESTTESSAITFHTSAATPRGQLISIILQLSLPQQETQYDTFVVQVGYPDTLLYEDFASETLPPLWVIENLGDPPAWQFSDATVPNNNDYNDVIIPEHGSFAWLDDNGYGPDVQSSAILGTCTLNLEAAEAAWFSLQSAYLNQQNTMVWLKYWNPAGGWQLVNGQHLLSSSQWISQVFDISSLCGSSEVRLGLFFTEVAPDSGSAIAVDDILVTIRPQSGFANHDPILLNPPTSLEMQEDQISPLQDFNPCFSDPDGDSLVIQISGCDHLQAVEAGYNSFRFYPDADWWGVDSVEVIARDPLPGGYKLHTGCRRGPGERPAGGDGYSGRAVPGDERRRLQSGSGRLFQRCGQPATFLLRPRCSAPSGFHKQRTSAGGPRNPVDRPRFPLAACHRRP
jgi:hypothetical protein